MQQVRHRRRLCKAEVSWTIKVFLRSIQPAFLADAPYKQCEYRFHFSVIGLVCRLLHSECNLSEAARDLATIP